MIQLAVVQYANQPLRIWKHLSSALWTTSTQFSTTYDWLSRFSANYIMHILSPNSLSRLLFPPTTLIVTLTLDNIRPLHFSPKNNCRDLSSLWHFFPSKLFAGNQCVIDEFLLQRSLTGNFACSLSSWHIYTYTHTHIQFIVSHSHSLQRSTTIHTHHEQNMILFFSLIDIYVF